MIQISLLTNLIMLGDNRTLGIKGIIIGIREEITIIMTIEEKERAKEEREPQAMVGIKVVKGKKENM